MWLDIGLCIFFLIWGFVGWHNGFMHSIVGFVSGALSFVAALFLTSPLAKLLDSWFGMNKLLTWGVVSGNIVNFVMCFIIITAVIWLVFLALKRFIKIVKQENKVVDKIDKVAGIVLGIAKGFLIFALVAGLANILSGVGFIKDAIDNVLKGSYVGKPLYDLVVMMWPDVAKAVNGFF